MDSCPAKVPGIFLPLMYKVGLTGGIGAGKSTVARIFEILGIPVYYADKEAKRLMEEDENLVSKIKYHFGEEVYEKGKLQRKLLSDKVFTEKEKLILLNEIVHPVTLRDGRTWMEKQQSIYVIKEAALIFESGSQSEFDIIIGVHAPVSVRIHRILKRENTTRDKVIDRIKYQLDESIKMKLCNDILINDEQHLLIPQVLRLHEKLISMATEKLSHA